MQRVWGVIRYSGVGVFFTGIIAVIQGCDAREGIGALLLMVLLQMCTAADMTNDDSGATAPAPLPPTVTTNAASGVTSTTATLNGTVNANGASTTVTFEFGLTTGYGTTITADQSPVAGTSDTAVSKFISGLTAGSTYHYRVVGGNAGGTTYGADMTFTASPLPPTVATTAATSLLDTTATLNGTVNANGASTTVTFEYGLTTAYGTTVTADQSPVAGTSDTAVSKAISGLTAGTTYHYRVVGGNAGGTTYGVDMTFSTGCFTADTKVLMADRGYKRIVDVQVGDMVMTYDSITRTQVPHRVEQTHKFHTESFLRINDLEVTAGHPFAIGQDQWLTAGELQVGDRVFQGDGFTQIVRVETVIQSAAVYTLTVSGTHNFYVSDGEKLYLVHNKT